MICLEDLSDTRWACDSFSPEEWFVLKTYSDTQCVIRLTRPRGMICFLSTRIHDEPWDSLGPYGWLIFYLLRYPMSHATHSAQRDNLFFIYSDTRWSMRLTRPIGMTYFYLLGYPMSHTTQSVRGDDSTYSDTRWAIRLVRSWGWFIWRPSWIPDEPYDSIGPLRSIMTFLDTWWAIRLIQPRGVIWLTRISYESYNLFVLMSHMTHSTIKI